MEWNDVWKIVLCAVGSAGGVGAIIVCSVNFTATIVANRLSQKYETKLQRELEQHRSKLEGKNHITKAQYDVEFGIYRALSKTFFEMVLTLNTVFSSDYHFSQTVCQRGFLALRSQFDDVATKMQAAQDTLYENSAFISKTLYEKYDTILDAASALFWEYKEKVFAAQSDLLLADYEWFESKHETVTNLRKKLFALNEDLRAYLESLTIVD